MNKTKRGYAVQIDKRRPSKPESPTTGKGKPQATGDTPAYDGPKKTQKAPTRKSRGAKAVKTTVGQVQRPRASARPAEFGDQVPPRKRRAAGSAGGGPAGEQYIRLRVRVSRDRLTVLDSHLVDGPLSQTQGFATANAYEVSIEDRLLHAGALPDLGMQRSFVNPDGPPEQHGHHFTERPVYEFTARVPAHRIQVA